MKTYSTQMAEMLIRRTPQALHMAAGKYEKQLPSLARAWDAYWYCLANPTSTPNQILHVVDELRSIFSVAAKKLPVLKLAYEYFEEDARHSTKMAYLEIFYEDLGRKTIVIPDKETQDIVDSINIDDIDYNTLRPVRLPYECFSIVFAQPQHIPYNQAQATQPVLFGYSPYDVADDRPFGLIQTKGSSHAPIVAYSHPKRVADDMNNTDSEAFKGMRDNLDECHRTCWFMSFGVKLGVLLQVMPELLKEGPGVEELIRVKRKNGKFKNKKIKLDSMHLVVPDRFRRSQSAHWCPPHFRSLTNPRYRREDDQGNLLEVGEPGNIRIIQVRGYLTKGTLEHVDKNA